MKYLKFFFVLIFVISSCASNKNNVIDTDDYKIVNAYFEHFHGAKKVLYLKSYNYDWRKFIASGVLINHYSDNFRKKLIKTKKRFNFEDYITNQDLKNMVSQINPVKSVKSVKSVKWDKKKLNSIETSKAKRAIKFSLPVYSLNKEIAAVFIDDYNSTYITFFKKKNNMWEFYFSGTVEIE